MAPQPNLPALWENISHQQGNLHASMQMQAPSPLTKGLNLKKTVPLELINHPRGSHCA
jgi:hypothetical protein